MSAWATRRVIHMETRFLLPIENKGLGLDDQVEVRQRGENGELVLSVYPSRTRSGAQKKERRLELSAQEAALISVVGTPYK